MHLSIQRLLFQNSLETKLSNPFSPGGKGFFFTKPYGSSEEKKGRSSGWLPVFIWKPKKDGYSAAAFLHPTSKWYRRPWEKTWGLRHNFLCQFTNLAKRHVYRSIDGKVAYTDWTCDQKHCEVGNSTLLVRHNHLCKNQKVKGSGSPKWILSQFLQESMLLFIIDGHISIKFQSPLASPRCFPLPHDGTWQQECHYPAVNKENSLKTKRDQTSKEEMWYMRPMEYMQSLELAWKKRS